MSDCWLPQLIQSGNYPNDRDSFMASIEKCKIPDGALLGRYAKNGNYTDCFVTEVSGPVSHTQYVTAFYTTTVFKLERAILKWVISMPSTDVQAGHLARGSIDAFAAWKVESRCENQLLMSDIRGGTRSWLMVVPVASCGKVRTRLYFGSAVVAKRNPAMGRFSLGLLSRSLLGFHKAYSKVLLYTVRLRLEAQLS